MPKISEFYGIAIYMYYREHQPPHFHAIYGDDEALVSLDSLAIIKGSLSPRAMGLVVEWASQHKRELKRAWSLAATMQPLRQIKPLK